MNFQEQCVHRITDIPVYKNFLFTQPVSLLSIFTNTITHDKAMEKTIGSVEPTAFAVDESTATSFSYRPSIKKVK